MRVGLSALYPYRFPGLMSLFARWHLTDWCVTYFHRFPLCLRVGLVDTPRHRKALIRPSVLPVLLTCHESCSVFQRPPWGMHSLYSLRVTSPRTQPLPSGRTASIIADQRFPTAFATRFDDEGRYGTCVTPLIGSKRQSFALINALGFRIAEA